MNASKQIIYMSIYSYISFFYYMPLLDKVSIKKTKPASADFVFSYLL